MSLHGAIDDATSTGLALHFRPIEDLHGYTTLLAAIATHYGLPLAFYGDRLNVFLRNDPNWTLEEELHGAQRPTHFGQMLQSLGIAFIPAGSPQAKGRIERLWQTLQDRLVSELRLRRVATLETANAFLPTFLADYNRRFARPPPRPQPPGGGPRAPPVTPGPAGAHKGGAGRPATFSSSTRGTPTPPSAPARPAPTHAWRAGFSRHSRELQHAWRTRTFSLNS